MSFTPIVGAPNFGTVKCAPLAGWPTVVANGTTWNSDLIAGGFGALVFCATADQIVTLQIQRYADLAGNIPVGGLLTQALTANTAGFVGATDFIPFLSFNLQIVNASGSDANITNIGALTGPL